MNTTLNEHSVSCNYSQSRDHSANLTGQMNIRADVKLKGSKDIKERTACALRTKTATITVERCGYNTSGLAACCSGTWKGKRWFAKILLADPYPIPPRFRAPWEPVVHTNVPLRTITEQMDIEWDMTLKMLRLSGDRSVPVPLGRSLAARTIVWEEAGGTSLVRTLKWSRWRGSMAKSGAEALFKSGVWLRKIHDASLQAMVVIEARRLIQTAAGSSQQKQSAASHYQSIASRILEAASAGMGETGNFEMPLALTHGDFCLSNLLWKISGKQLAVIDFEFSGFRPIYFDLFALIADLRAMLLNPLIPKSVIQQWEESFWRGYGQILPNAVTFVKALALARVFYYHFPRLLTRRERKGWVGGINAQLYRTFLERRVISQRLDLPPEFARSNHNLAS